MVRKSKIHLFNKWREETGKELKTHKEWKINKPFELQKGIIYHEKSPEKMYLMVMFSKTLTGTITIKNLKHGVSQWKIFKNFWRFIYRWKDLEKYSSMILFSKMETETVTISKWQGIFIWLHNLEFKKMSVHYWYSNF